MDLREGWSILGGGVLGGHSPPNKAGGIVEGHKRKPCGCDLVCRLTAICKIEGFVLGLGEKHENISTVFDMHEHLSFRCRVFHTGAGSGRFT